MPFGGSDGKYYDDHLDYLMNSSMPAQPLPEGIKKVIIGPKGTGDQGMVLDPDVNNFHTEDQNIVPPTDSTMPPRGSTEPAGALKVSGSTDTPGKVPETNFEYPEPYGLNPPEQGPGFESPPRPPAKVLFHTASPLVNITDQDIEDAVNIGLSVGPGAIKVKPTQLPPWAPEMPKPVGPTDYNIFQAHGYSVDTSKLSPNQMKDFIDLKSRYTQGDLTTSQYKSELKEYADYTAAGGWGGKTHTEKVMDDIKKILDEMEPIPGKKIPITESGNDAYIDMFLKQPNFDKIEKLSPKEAFKRGVEQALQGFKVSAAEAKNKMMNALRGPIGDLIQGPKVTPRGEYTEPAYRGMTIHQGGDPNSYYDFNKSPLMYSTANPMLADMYAGYLSSHPGIKVAPGTFPHNAQVMPLLVNIKDYHHFDAKGEIWQKANPKAIAEAQRLKKKGVVVDNVWDEPESTTALGRPNKVYITFPEGASTVKSRFAKKFDPSSENVMHGIGTIGIGTATAGYISSEKTE